MKAKLKKIARVSLKVVAAAIDPLFGPLPGPRILIYHQVGVNLGREMEVSTATFIKHVDWMQAQGQIVDLETAIERRGEPDADKLFVVTFDDGFEDVYLNAFPILKERVLPFTLYLTSHPIETGEPIDPRYPEARPLSWDQVNEMVASGLVTAGAHTHTHADLRKLPADGVSNELDASDALLEKRLSSRPRHFTYPWGWPSDTADRVVRERYESSTVGSPTGPRSDDESHRIPRFPVQLSDGLWFFKRRMRGGFRLEEWLRRTLARIG